jgi:hypothetical protein
LLLSEVEGILQTGQNAPECADDQREHPKGVGSVAQVDVLRAEREHEARACREDEQSGEPPEGESQRITVDVVQPVADRPAAPSEGNTEHPGRAEEHHDRRCGVDGSTVHEEQVDASSDQHGRYETKHPVEAVRPVDRGDDGDGVHLLGRGHGQLLSERVADVATEDDGAADDREDHQHASCRVLRDLGEGDEANQNHSDKQGWLIGQGVVDHFEHFPICRRSAGSRSYLLR